MASFDSLFLALGITAALAAGRAFFFADPRLADIPAMLATHFSRSIARNRETYADAATVPETPGNYGSVLSRKCVNIAASSNSFQTDEPEGSQIVRFVHII